jgi:hypothetical protein
LLQQEDLLHHALPEFLDKASINLDTILEKWVNIEQASWEAEPPEDPAEAIKGVRNETDSLIDLEIEAIQRDIEALQQDANWEEEIIKSADAVFQSTVSELRNKYQLKLGAFAGAQKKRIQPINPTSNFDPAPPAPKASYSGGSGGGSNSGALFLFIVGLVLGSAPSVYFWDAGNRIEKKFITEKSKLETNQKLIEDGYALLRDVFGQMASGKIRNLVDTEDELRKLKSDSAARRKRLEQEFADDRERLMKKSSSGNKLDRALEDLEYRKVQTLGAAKDQDNAEIEKREKQIKMIKDLLAG